MKIKKLLQEYPFLNSYFEMNELNISGWEEYSFEEYLNHFTEEELEDRATDRKTLLEGLETFKQSMLTFLGTKIVETLTILPGYHKDGSREAFKEIILKKSDIISIVGPTGSGKSRLLSDIEWMAQGDTPTGRRILINGKTPSFKERFSTQDKLVAQLSQNMNFVMDLSVEEFIELHCKSRLVDPQEKMDKIMEDANLLAGEAFSMDTPITALSGGQSRALMISDTANISTSPIVLIDEIENAGIDRQKAVELLVSSEKIVLMATHDPTLALMANRRIVIKNGGIADIIETKDSEKEILEKLQEMDHFIHHLRENLRRGNHLKNI
ncbi:MAG: ATP-binding cassette domain-containing protein [Tissierellia bacterium]|nr:ATP-binding cassette domain-containing protein [Tissierellia bacterium]